MPTNKKPRKRYRKKHTLLDPVGWLLEGMSLIYKDEQLRILAINHNALAELVRGRGTLEHWGIVTAALNCAVVLDEQCYDYMHHEPLMEALRAHGRCGVRKQKHGSFGYTGPDLSAVNFALEIHDEQMKRATFREVDRAIAETTRRSKSKGEHFSVAQMAECQKDQHGQREPQLLCR